MESFIVQALKLAGRPMPLAELVQLKFGDVPTGANREAVAAAARQLEAHGQVSSEMQVLPNAAGRRNNQRVLTLLGAEQPVEPVVDDELTRLTRVPAVICIDGADGLALADDYRATHQYMLEHEWSVKDVRDMAADCDDACRAARCIRIANWRRPITDQIDLLPEELLAQPAVADWLSRCPRPVVSGPDGELWEVAESATVSEVVERQHAGVCRYL